MIENQLLPQAYTVASAVNDNFTHKHPKIAFAELQFESETGAWFSHVIWEDDDNANLTKEEISSKWFNNLSAEINEISAKFQELHSLDISPGTTVQPFLLVQV